MDILIKWLTKQINIPKNLHNENTYMWSKGYRKACSDILEFINKIENK